ncbi:MAG TPA: NAD(P)-dependent oxidoreductase [Candidatus Paceibacterota bacterium]
MNTKVVFYESDAGEEKIFRELLGDTGGGMEMTFCPDRLSSENVAMAGEAEVLSVFVGSMVTRELLEHMPHLKHIVTRSTGTDHIDLVALKERGISLSSVPSYGARAVAEHAFALLLSLSRRTFEAHDQIQEEGKFEVGPLQGFDLFGKTLGVIGTGKIGKNSARIGRGFGMNILLVDMYPDEKFASEVEGKYLPLDDLLAQADIITLHCPYTKKNHHMLGAVQFGKMKRGVTIINTARGELMDTIALVGALESGVVAHVGLDVLEGERMLKDEAELVLHEHKIDELKTIIADHVLVDDKRVLITPHIAFHSLEADRERLATTADNIKSFLSGTPQNEIKLGDKTY